MTSFSEENCVAWNEKIGSGLEYQKPYKVWQDLVTKRNQNSEIV